MDRGGARPVLSRSSWSGVARLSGAAEVFDVVNYARNGGIPSGLDVRFGAVPEISTSAMMLAGFAALGFAGYRRNRTVGAFDA